MLYKETVETGTLELLKELQSEPLLAGFNLVGGTSLALRLGHRKSIDLDLFISSSFDQNKVRELLQKKYGMRISFDRDQTIKGFIGDVMVDCIRYDYPLLYEPDIIEGIRIESLPDVISMKLAAISQDGTRLKDFIDIAFLSSCYSFEDMLGFYEKKYPTSNKIMPAKGLTYFEDIDFEEPIVLMDGNFKWKIISKRLLDMEKHPKVVFNKL